MVYNSDIFPPDEVFQFTPNYADPADTMVKSAAGDNLGGFVKTVCPPEGGIYLFRENQYLPKKGHPYTSASIANNQVKRNTLIVFYPFTCKSMRIPMLIRLLLPNKKEFFEEILAHYLMSCDAIYKSVFPIPYLKKQYYKNCGRELWDLSYNFLTELGISKPTAENFGRLIATIIEYEDVYQYVLEDLFTETTKEKLLNNPRKEFLALAKILQRRASISTLTIGGKFMTLIKFASFILLFPKVKKAFRKSLEKVNFKNLQLDDGDSYNCMINTIDYKFFDKTCEQRLTLLNALISSGQLKMKG